MMNTGLSSGMVRRPWLSMTWRRASAEDIRKEPSHGFGLEEPDLNQDGGEVVNAALAMDQAVPQFIEEHDRNAERAPGWLHAHEPTGVGARGTADEHHAVAVDQQFVLDEVQVGERGEVRPVQPLDGLPPDGSATSQRALDPPIVRMIPGERRRVEMIPVRLAPGEQRDDLLSVHPRTSVGTRGRLGLPARDGTNGRGHDPLPASADFHAEPDADPAKPQQATAETGAVEARGSRIGEEAPALDDDLLAARHDDLVAGVAGLDDQRRQRLEREQ